MSLAAERTGIGRNTVYLRRKVDPSFALGWRNAVEMAAEALRDAAITHALDGDIRLLMFLLRAVRPEVYGRRVPKLSRTGPGHRRRSDTANNSAQF